MPATTGSSWQAADNAPHAERLGGPLRREGEASRARKRCSPFRSSTTSTKPPNGTAPSPSPFLARSRRRIRTSTRSSTVTRPTPAMGASRTEPPSLPDQAAILRVHIPNSPAHQQAWIRHLVAQVRPGRKRRRGDLRDGQRAERLEQHAPRRTPDRADLRGDHRQDPHLRARRQSDGPDGEDGRARGFRVGRYRGEPAKARRALERRILLDPAPHGQPAAGRAPAGLLRRALLPDH